MAPTLDYTTNPWSWSSCSAAQLTEFLESVFLLFDLLKFQKNYVKLTVKTFT